jgi:hypothetical protein
MAKKEPCEAGDGWPIVASVSSDDINPELFRVEALGPGKVSFVAPSRLDLDNETGRATDATSAVNIYLDRETYVAAILTEIASSMRELRDELQRMNHNMERIHGGEDA